MGMYGRGLPEADERHVGMWMVEWGFPALPVNKKAIAIQANLNVFPRNRSS